MIPALRLVVVSIGLLQAVTAQIQQHSGEEAAKQLVVMIDGTVGGSPTFGAGIIFGHTPQRLYIATADHIVRRGRKEAEEIRLQFRSLPGEEIEARRLKYSLWRSAPPCSTAAMTP